MMSNGNNEQLCDALLNAVKHMGDQAETRLTSLVELSKKPTEDLTRAQTAFVADIARGILRTINGKPAVYRT